MKLLSYRHCVLIGCQVFLSLGMGIPILEAAGPAAPDETETEPGVPIRSKIPILRRAFARTQPAAENRGGGRYDAHPDVAAVTQIYKLKYTDPANLAEILTTLHGSNLIVVADKRTSTLIVKAAPDVLKSVDETFANLDVPVPPQNVRIFSLQHAKVAEVEDVINAALNWRDTRSTCTADARTNSLVINAPDAQMSVAEQLLKALDVESSPGVTPNAPQQPIKVFSLRHLNARQSLESVLTLLLRDRGDAAFDMQNRVVVRADPATLLLVADLLTKLDVEPEVKPNSNAVEPAAIRARLVWLVSGGEKMELPAPPDDLAEVIQELGKVGVTGLRLAAQTMVEAVSDEPFTVSSSAMLENPWRLSASNKIVVHKESPDLNPSWSIELTGGEQLDAPGGPPRPPGRPEAATFILKTAVSAPLGHPVVLGVTPIGKKTSAFVLQVFLTGKSHKPPAPAPEAPAK